jgi:sRNA-binding regulator protein Hfq
MGRFKMVFHCPICNLKMFTEDEERQHAKTHKQPQVQPQVAPIESKPTPQVSSIEAKRMPEESKKPFKMPEFLGRFLRKKIKVTLLNGSFMERELSGFNNYDIFLDNSIIIPKHAIMTIQESVKGEV